MAIPAVLVALGRMAATAIARTSVGAVASRVAGSAAVPGASSTFGELAGAFRGMRDGFNLTRRLGAAVARRQHLLQYTPLANTQRRQQLTTQIEKLQSKQIAAFGQLATSAMTAAKGLAGLTLAAVRAPGYIEQLGAARIDSVRGRETINGSYAVSAARLDFSRFRREQETAQGTANSFDALTRSQDQLEERTAKYYRAVENVKNWAHSAANSAASAMIAVAENSWIWSVPSFGLIPNPLRAADIINQLSGEGNKNAPPVADLVNFLARGDHRRKPPLAGMQKGKQQ